MSQPSTQSLRELIELGVKQGICDRVNSTRHGGRPVLPADLIGAFYRDEIKFHVEALLPTLESALGERQADAAIIGPDGVGNATGANPLLGERQAQAEYCPTCHKLRLIPGMNYGINPDAVCQCYQGKSNVQEQLPAPAARWAERLRGRTIQDVFRLHLRSYELMLETYQRVGDSIGIATTEGQIEAMKRAIEVADNFAAHEAQQAERIADELEKKWPNLYMEGFETEVAIEIIKAALAGH